MLEGLEIRMRCVISYLPLEIPEVRLGNVFHSDLVVHGRDAINILTDTSLALREDILYPLNWCRLSFLRWMVLLILGLVVFQRTEPPLSAELAFHHLQKRLLDNARTQPNYIPRSAGGST